MVARDGRSGSEASVRWQAARGGRGACAADRRASTPARSPLPRRAAKHWLLSSIIWLTVVDLFGLVLATEFVTPEAFGGISWLSFSRDPARRTSTA